MSAILRIEGVHAGYGEGADILVGVDLAVDADAISVIIGPNGAGKSTLMKAVFGLAPVRRGRVVFAGRDITGLDTARIARLGMSYVPQESNVFQSMSVHENLEMGAYLRDDDWSGQLRSVYRLFPRLEERRDQTAGTLSGGERQMLAIGRALMIEPKLLLLDEPTAGLSPAIRIETFELIEKVKALGVGILMVEQNARQALEIADRGFVMVMGAKRHEDSGAGLLADRRVGEMFLGA
jgi:branched-chain amino acid transport system ATP-binding protein